MRSPVAIAIVLAGALIGLGLFLGLRAMAPPPAAIDPTGSGAASGGGPGGVVVRPAIPIRDDPAKVRADALAAVERLRAEAREICWKPAVKRQPNPDRSTYRLAITFAGSGQELLRGVSEVRGKPSRSDVSACLQNLPLNLTIPPPGGAAQYDDLTLELP